MPNDRPKVALVTGANAGLGFAICQRLAESGNIKIVLTTRTHEKATEAIASLPKLPDVTYEHVILDLGSMNSVVAAIRAIKSHYKHIDYFFMNAGYGTFTGMNFVTVAQQLLREGILPTFTQPRFKMQSTGDVSKDGMGAVFQTNVFGHWVMLQELVPRLQPGGRAIWVSSIEALPHNLDIDDIQCYKSSTAYESSKRLIDLLHFASYADFKEVGVYTYVAHPGLCNTSIVNTALYPGFFTAWLAVAHFCRWLGSPWHTITAYSGANFAKFLLQDNIDQDVKWGSGDDHGKELIRTTPVVQDEESGEKVYSTLQQMYKAWNSKNTSR